MYGHGESEGDIERLTVSKVVDNVLALHRYAKSKGYTRIGLSGSSFTGIVSLIAASKRDFAALSLKCPVFDSKRLWDRRYGKKGVQQWKRRGYVKPFDIKWYYEAYEDASRYDMEAIASRVKAPTLVIHGDKDETVPIQHAKDIISYVGGEKRLVIVKGADHFFKEASYFKKMIYASRRWLSSHLR
jgi:esterase/lipase